MVLGSDHKMKEGKMNITELPIGELKPYENNPRINDEAVPFVAESIKNFGWQQPIVIDRDNVIVAGHTRYKAALRLGLETVPCKYADELTPEQVRQYRLADNKTAELATWDDEKLIEELKKCAQFDMSAFGFEEPAKESTKQVTEDHYEQEEVEHVAKRGDVFQLGEHRLMCGDSTNTEDLQTLLGGVRLDMVLTDPPYGMGLDSDFSSMYSKLNQDFAHHEMKGTNYQIGNVDTFTPEMIKAIYSLNAPETFMFGADYYAELIPDRNKGSWIVWDKRTSEGDELEDSEVALDRGYGSCFELCYSKKKHKREIARVKWSGLFGMENEFDRKRCHPTQKPILLASWFIDKYSKEGQSIADIFGGSGSTMIAAEQLGRKCYMMELDPHYCDVIIDRWQKFTGGKAVILND